VHEAYGTSVAQVAEVSMQDGKVKVQRVVCAVDCGVAVNPDVIGAQMEGGIGFTLSALYYGKIEIKAGRAVQRNFDSYKALRIREMPKVEVHIVPSTEKPTGVGEPGVPPLTPPVANAVFKLGGQRVRAPLNRQRRDTFPTPRIREKRQLSSPLPPPPPSGDVHRAQTSRLKRRPATTGYVRRRPRVNDT
jgi:CO/xanthine dehydrogenase Mo-binding subunit